MSRPLATLAFIGLVLSGAAARAEFTSTTVENGNTFKVHVDSRGVATASLRYADGSSISTHNDALGGHRVATFLDARGQVTRVAGERTAGHYDASTQTSHSTVTHFNQHGVTSVRATDTRMYGDNVHSRTYQIPVRR